MHPLKLLKNTARLVKVGLMGSILAKVWFDYFFAIFATLFVYNNCMLVDMCWFFDKSVSGHKNFRKLISPSTSGGPIKAGRSPYRLAQIMN